MSNNVFIIKKLKGVREYKKNMRIKRIDFELSIIDSFHRFFSKKSINENVNNSKTKHSSLNFNGGLTKTLKKIFRNIYNDLNESSFFEWFVINSFSYLNRVVEDFEYDFSEKTLAYNYWDWSHLWFISIVRKNWA